MNQPRNRLAGYSGLFLGRFTRHGGGGLQRKARRFVDLYFSRDQLGFHQSTDLEFDGPFRRNCHLFEGLGVLGDSRRPQPTLEDAEVAKLQTVPVAQLLNDRIQEGLDDVSDDCALGARRLRDAIDELFLRDRGHEQHPTSAC